MGCFISAWRSKYSFTSSFFFMLMTLLPRMMTLEIHYIFVKYHSVVCKLEDTKEGTKKSNKKISLLLFMLLTCFFSFFWFILMEKYDRHSLFSAYVCNPIELCLRLITIVNTSIWYDLLSVAYIKHTINHDQRVSFFDTHLKRGYVELCICCGVLATCAQRRDMKTV